VSAARALRNLRIAAVSSVVALLALAHAQGLLERFGDPQGLARTLVELGPWGYAAFIAAYTLLQPFGVPGTVFIVAAPAISSQLLRSEDFRAIEAAAARRLVGSRCCCLARRVGELARRANATSAANFEPAELKSTHHPTL